MAQVRLGSLRASVVVSEDRCLVRLPGSAGGAREQQGWPDGWKTMRPSLDDTVFFVVGFKVFIHATGVGHLFAIDLWQELRVLHSPLLVEQDISRVGVDLLGLHFLVRENRSQSQVVNMKAR